MGMVLSYKQYKQIMLKYILNKHFIFIFKNIEGGKLIIKNKIVLNILH